MALINVGGAIRVADAYITLAHDNPLNPAHNTLAQLARTCDKTSVQLRTGESVDNFNLRISIEQLPPLDSVLPLLMQLSQVDLTAKARATKPQPADGAVFGLTPQLQLKWKPGVNAKSHKVYFGTEADELSLLAEVKTPDDAELPPLEEGLTYYWRVDEIWADGTVVTGDIWSFTIGELVGWWKFDESEGNKAADSSGFGNDGTLVGEPKWQPGRVGGALMFDGDGDHVLVPNGGEHLNGLGALTVCLWVKSNVTKTDKGFIIFEDPDTHDNRDMRYDAAGIYGGGTNLIKCGVTSGADEGPEGWPGRQQIESSSNIQTSDWQHIAMTWSSGNRVALYINGKSDTPTSVEPAKVGTLIGYTKLIIGKGGKDVETNESWNGLIDDVRIYNYALSQEEIETVYRVKAVKPRPVDGAVLGPATKVELSWAPGIDAVSHRVAFGKEPEELALPAVVTSPAYARLPALEKDTTYYWRVDEVQANGTVVSGDIWSFTTSGRLLGWWKLDEASGGTAEDNSGSGHNGTLHGDQGWQPTGGKVGGALKLDGDGDYVEVSDESDFDLTGQITVAAWIKAKEFDKERQAIVTKGGSAWRLHRNLKTDNIRFNITYGYEPSVVGKINVNDGQWHHIAGAYDGAELCLYVDGELDSSKKTSKSIMTNNEPVCIGENSEQTGRYWNGLIDDVRIYNYALSRDEVAALYQGK